VVAAEARDRSGLQRKVEGRTNTVARTFDRICDALEARGYLADGGTVVTERGERLRRSTPRRTSSPPSACGHDVWKRLDAAGLAAAVSALVHEPRHEEAEVSPRMPNDDVAEALTRMSRLWSEIEDLETEHDLPSTSMPDGGMAWMVHRWASGERLDTVLRGQDMAAGDFVRRCKQIVDLLDQVAKAATDASCAARPAPRWMPCCAASSPPTASTERGLRRRGPGP
jgi:ATP-dependent RNA helicase HelY